MGAENKCFFMRLWSVMYPSTDRGDQPARRAVFSHMRDSRRAIDLAVYLSQTGRIRGSQAVSDTESAPICTGPHGVHKVSCAYFRCTATGVTFCTGLPGAHSSALDVERAEIPAENRAERNQASLRRPGRRADWRRFFGWSLRKSKNLRKEAERAVPTAASLPLKRRERSEFRSGS